METKGYVYLMVYILISLLYMELFSTRLHLKRHGKTKMRNQKEFFFPKRIFDPLLGFEKYNQCFVSWIRTPQSIVDGSLLTE